VGARKLIVRWLPIVLCGIALAGCHPAESFFVPSDEKQYVPSDWTKVKAHYKAKLRGVWGTQWEMKSDDPQGVFTGTAKLLSSTGTNPVGALIKSLGRVKTAGTIIGVYGNTGATTMSVNGIGLMSGRHSVGALCVTFSAQSVRGNSDQLFLGTFRVVGGTRRADRVHGSGTFVILQPNRLKSYDRPFSMHVAVTFKSAFLGHPRGFTAACRNATKPKLPPKPKKLKATLAGWAFAAGGASTHSLPPGTTVYPSGATVTGAAGCGASDNLYWVIDYSGPNDATLSAYVLKGLHQKLVQGRNLVFLGSAPPNGPLSGKGEVDASGYTPVAFTPSLQLSRSC
jgi:hypothetical protein